MFSFSKYFSVLYFFIFYWCGLTEIARNGLSLFLQTNLLKYLIGRIGRTT